MIEDCVIKQSGDWVRSKLLNTHVARTGGIVAVVAAGSGKLTTVNLSDVYIGRCPHCAAGLVPVIGTDAMLWHGRDHCPDKGKQPL